MDWRASPYVTPKAGTSVAEGQVVRICQSPYWSQEARQGSVGTVVSKKVTHAGRGWETWLVKVQMAGGEIWSFYESELVPLELTRADRRRAIMRHPATRGRVKR